MVSKAASTSMKRKKDADMPESPPKRVTRSRAKAAGDVEPQSKVTKITTESAKVSAESKRRVAPAKTTKRKTRADDATLDPIVEACTEEVPKKEPAKTQGRPKKVKDEGKEKPLKVEAPATTKDRSAKTLVSEEISTEASKPRGRPRKPANTTNDVTTEPKGPKNATMEKKRIRGRPAAIAAKPVTANPVTKALTTRKKVKFEDEDEKDKENIPLPVKALEKPAVKATGMKAKPIRKPTSTKVTRGRKVGNEEKNISEEKAEQPRSQPFSPKKVVQIAKSSSIGSEDELCGEKTTVKALSRSPVKPPMSPIREIDKPLSKLDFGSVKSPSSPEKIMSSNILASPARRPPSSPFKDAFKESPKRVNLGDSFAHAVPLAPHSPMKASLLQSPARRLAASTIALNAQASLVKSAPAMPVVDAATASKQTKPSSFSDFSLEKAVSSPLRALGSPGQSFKVYKVPALEQEAESYKSPNTPGQPSPLQSDTAQKTPPTFLPVTDTVDFAVDAHSVLDLSSSPVPLVESASVDYQKPISENIGEESEVGNKVQPVDTTLQPPISVAPGFSFASSSLRSAPEDSESEDELSSSHESHAPIQFGDRRVSSKYATAHASALTRTGAKTKIPRHSETEFSMTPLATQLSTWLASSPEKKAPAVPVQRKRGIFSPVGPTLFDRPERSDTPGSSESPPKSSFFEDEMVAREEDEDDSIHAQSENEEVLTEIEASQGSQGSEQYGDENAMPLDPPILALEPTYDNLTSTCTPAKVFSSQPREIHTVSKVPLRPAGDDSPIKVPRKRSRSLAGPLTVVESPEKYDFGYSNNALTFVGGSSASNHVASESHPTENHETPVKSLPCMPQTPGTGILSNLGSPIKTVRKGVVPNVLQGAVVYVDVHTTEGADASGIFLDLLTQMGARCVKQWLWNPRSGSNSSADDAANTLSDAETPGGKVGITHVVYKDGGRRTLEKVREAKGVVLCVGVGWVLEYVGPQPYSYFSSDHYANLKPEQL